MSNAKCYGIGSTAWFKTTTIALGTTPSWRSLVHARSSQPVVAAIGGNSLEGLEKDTAINIAFLANRHSVVVTHGNGPQVGKKLDEAEEQNVKKSINEATAETQVEIGEILKQNILEVGNWLYPERVEVISTRVIVDPNDPAFKHPTKYIGEKFSLEYFAYKSSKREDGLYDWVEKGNVWTMKEVPGKPNIFQRVVPSPKPLRIHPQDLAKTKNALAKYKIAIAVGGGGIPIFPDGSPVEAVIDKDLATALLWDCCEMN
jgi:carbamate kinase